MYTCPLTRRAGLNEKRERKEREEVGWEPRGAGLLNEPFRKNYVIRFCVCVCFFKMLLPKLRIEKYSMGIMSETHFAGSFSNMSFLLIH